MSFQDIQIDETHAAELSCDYIQYRRGDLKNENQLLKNGCFLLPVDTFGSVVGNALPVAQVSFGAGATKGAYLLSVIHIAPLAVWKRWFVYEGDRIRYLDAGEYTEGAKSHFKILGVVRELVEAADFTDPIYITTKGMNAKHLEDAFKQFKSDVVGMAKRMTKKRFSTYHFWMPVTNGPREETKKGSYITPPKLALDQITEEIVERLYIGDELVPVIADYYSEAQEWAKKGKPQDNGSDPQDDDREPEEAF